MAKQKLRMRLVVCFVCYGINLVHVHAYLNPFPARKAPSFLPIAAQVPQHHHRRHHFRHHFRRREPSISTNSNYRSHASLLFSSSVEDVDPSSLSLQELISRLDELGIRYPPTATRTDLEALLGGQTVTVSVTGAADLNAIADDPPVSDEGSSSSPVNDQQHEQQQRRSIQDLLSELHNRNIRYSPTASRDDLEQLLTNHSNKPYDSEPSVNATSSSNTASSNSSSSSSDVNATNPSTRSQTRKIPIADLLRELDERNIRYPPTATRQDLEALLVVESLANKDRSDSPDSSQPQPVAAYEQHRAARARRRDNLQKKQERSPWRKILRKTQKVIPIPVALDLETLPEKLASTTSRTVNRATRKAQRFSRQAADLFTIDEDGVRDVDYEYLYKEERIRKPTVDVTAQRIETNTNAPSKRAPREPSTAPRPRRQRDRDPDRDRTARSPERTRFSRGVSPPPPPQNQSPLQTRLLLPSKLEGMPNPNQASPNSERAPRKTSRPTRQEASSKRRIYSPYKESEFEDRDIVDRVGDFFADTADRILWDNYDGSAATPKKRSSTKKQSKSTASAKNKTEARYWKDRLEERLDSMLGIHEDGNFYKKWEERMTEDQRNEGGTDAFSVAQGRGPKPRGGFGKRRKYDKSIWETEGNLISLLFGRSSSGDSLPFERLLDQDSGSLLHFFKAVFRSFLLVASYLSRWATVRGAIPQPVVVFGLITAGICARPRRRLRTVAIALIALRTAGELAHGYVYGEQGWEDEQDDEDEEFDSHEDES
jgi:hypothetical protein